MTNVDSDGASATATGDLGGRAARGALVTLAGQGTRLVLQLASVAVLARLLTPNDYGLLALVLVVIGIGEIFREFGLSTASIQAISLTRGQRDLLFWTNAGLGVFMALLLLVLADPIAAAWGRHELAPMLQVLTLTFVANGLATQYRADLNRSLRFTALVGTEVTAQAGGLIVGIACAASGAGYWALVAQQLVQAWLLVVGLALAARWLPGWPRGDRDIRDLIRMGMHFGATQGIYYAMNNLDTLTIGLRFPPATLGLYNRAFQSVSSPLNQLRAPATTVAVPVLTRVRDDPGRTAHYLRHGQLALAYTVVAGLSVACGAAHSVVLLLLGDRWSQVVPIFALLCVAGCMSTLAFVGLWIYLARGMGRQLMQYTLMTLVIQLVCIVGGSTWGVTGVAAGYLVAATVEWPLSLWWLSRQTVIPVEALLFGAVRALGCGAVAGLAAFAGTRPLYGAPAAVQVVAALGCGVVAYSALALLVPRVRSDLRIVYSIARRMLARRSAVPRPAAAASADV